MWLPAMVLFALWASARGCPNLCECGRTDGVANSLIADDDDETVMCRGRAPSLAELSTKTRRLYVSDADEYEVTNLLNELEYVGTTTDLEKCNATTNETSSLPCLDDLTLMNCSLVSLNVSWLGLELIHALNLSCNSLSNLDDAQVERMMNLSALTCLDLSRNAFREIGASGLGSLSRLTKLSLKGNEIASVSEDAFNGLIHLVNLDLSDNRLADLPDSALTPLCSLQKLDLSGNQLQVLGARWFESLDRLRELDVSRNGLARAASGTLQPLPGLSVLRLAENPLEERDVSLLLGTGRRLETVDASRTGLARVPAALTRSVRALRLAGNKLTAIRGGDLDSYPLLRMLDISDNRLVDVEEDALGRLEVLEELNVSGNLLTRVPGSLPSSLTWINLKNNSITILKFSDLQDLYNLKTLLLSNNDIVEIEEGSFNQLPVLNELDLSDNPIKVLSANALSGPSNLAVLRLSGLTSLKREEQKRGDMTFPLPSPERLIVLDVSRSPLLAAQLLADDATLSACKSLQDLNLSDTNIATLRSDLPYKLSQLRNIGLNGNDWNCTDELYWLGAWLRHHRNNTETPRCSLPSNLTCTLLVELPEPSNPLPTTVTAIRVPDISPYNDTMTTSRILPADAANDTLSPFSDVTATSTDVSENETSAGGTTPSNNPYTKANKAATAGVNHTEPRSTSVSYNTDPVTSIAMGSTRMQEAPTWFRNATTSIRKISRNGQTKKFSKKIEETSMKEESSSTVMDDIDNRINNLLYKSKNDSEKARSKSEYRNGEDTKGVTSERARNGSVSIDVASGTNTIAEELSVRASDSDARVSDSLSAGAHPGMLVLVGAAIGAAAALTVVLSRRATLVRRRRNRELDYQRHENIEVHALTPTNVVELW